MSTVKMNLDLSTSNTLEGSATTNDNNIMSSSLEEKSVLIVELFYGGSHKLLIDTLTKGTEDEHNYRLITLPAKKWHWRARCGALCIERFIPTVTTEKILFCSSVINLAELVGMRKDLQSLKKVVYFHENQLIYPKQQIKERDIQFAYNQIITCLVADEVIFNSYYNKESFLDNIKSVIKIIPDYRPKELRETIEYKCRVIYFPVQYPVILQNLRSPDLLHIVWPHRWEFDKGPEDFFTLMLRLKDNGMHFKLSVLGESFCDNPSIFETAKERLKDEIEHFGYVPSKEDYFGILSASHVVVSTSKHEFFGVSVLEATYCGCFPLLPNSLVYPEIYPRNCLYNNLDDAYEKLKGFCNAPKVAMEERSNLLIDFDKFNYKLLIEDYKKLLTTSD